MNPYLAFGLRVATVAILAGLASLKASIGDGLDAQEIVDVIYATIGSGAAYAGLGAVTPLEPRIGIKR